MRNRGQRCSAPLLMDWESSWQHSTMAVWTLQDEKLVHVSPIAIYHCGCLVYRNLLSERSSLWGAGHSIRPIERIYDKAANRARKK